MGTQGSLLPSAYALGYSSQYRPTDKCVMICSSKFIGAQPCLVPERAGPKFIESLAADRSMLNWHRWYLKINKLLP